VDLNFSAEETRLREELRGLLAEILPETWAGLWHEHNGRAVADHAVSELADRGWLTYHWPPEFGGQGGSAWEQAVIQEELFAHHEPRGGQYMGVNWIGPMVMKFGTEAQKAELLPEIAKGLVQWAQLYSEPGAGSDLAHLSTRAVLDGDQFVIDGEKVWTSYADRATRGFLLARTNSLQKGHRGISALLIPMNLPGITVREIPSAIGWHRLHAVSFTDVRVPRDALLGELHGGWAVAMASLPFERLGNARYARCTRILALIEREIVRRGLRAAHERALADCLAMGRMTELVNYSAIAANTRGEDISWRASAAFALNATYERAVAALAEEVLGLDMYPASPDPRATAGGEIESLAIRQAPTVTVQAGTYQIQLSVIARSALGFPRAR
jgi:alkylation response protein AidB-like acyl-CoA dehydrogenase